MQLARAMGVKWEDVPLDQQQMWDHFQTDSQLGNIAFQAQDRYVRMARMVAGRARVLNIGAGRGDLERMLLDRGTDVYCLDPGPETIRMLATRLGLGDKARQGVAEAIPFGDEMFDAVVMSEVLEHLDEGTMAQALEEVKRVLKPEGVFVGSVPADERLEDSLVLCPRCGLKFHRWGHLQSFSAGRLKQVLQSQFDRVAVSRAYFADPHTLNWKGRLLRLMKRSLLALGVHGSGETLVFQAVRT